MKTLQDMVFRLEPPIEHQYDVGMVLEALVGAVEELELPVDGPTLLAAIAFATAWTPRSRRRPASSTTTRCGTWTPPPL